MARANSESFRTGVTAMKGGAMAIRDLWGARGPRTAMWVHDSVTDSSSSLLSHHFGAQEVCNALAHFHSELVALLFLVWFEMILIKIGNDWIASYALEICFCLRTLTLDYYLFFVQNSPGTRRLQIDH